VEVSELSSFTVFTIIQIVLHLKLCVALLVLPFLCGCLPEQKRPILYSPTQVHISSIQSHHLSHLSISISQVKSSLFLLTSYNSEAENPPFPRLSSNSPSEDERAQDTILE
jgi:hypothetical protein